MDAQEWVGRVATAVGVATPTAAEVEDLLSLAGTAAHLTERWVAPVTCALVAAAGLTPAEGRALVEGLAAGEGG